MNETPTGSSFSSFNDYDVIMEDVEMGSIGTVQVTRGRSSYQLKCTMAPSCFGAAVKSAETPISGMSLVKQLANEHSEKH